MHDVTLKKKHNKCYISCKLMLAQACIDTTYFSIILHIRALKMLDVCNVLPMYICISIYSHASSKIKYISI